MGASVLDETGKQAMLHMGCYGIGVTRVVAAAIEQNHDARGIIWPDAIAPFQVVIVPINAPKSPRVRETAERLYNELLAAGVDVLLDDRDERPGVKFADAELIGIPHRVVVGDRGLEAGKLEYRHRRAEAAEEFPAGDALAFVRGKLAAALTIGRWACAHSCHSCCCRRWRFSAPAPEAQREPELKSAVQHAIDQAECFEDKFDSAVWYKMMEPRLRKRVPDREERMLILKTVFCEANRPGETKIPPGLVMAVMEIESNFNRYAVSYAGAVGLMQVMPFWPETLGMRRHQLDEDHGEHPHGMRDPARTISSARGTTSRARWRATTAASASAGIPTR